LKLNKNGFQNKSEKNEERVGNSPYSSYLYFINHNKQIKVMEYTQKEKAILSKTQFELQTICDTENIKAYKNPDQTGMVFDLEDDGLIKANFYFGEGIEWQSTQMSIRSSFIQQRLEKTVAVIFGIMNGKIG